MIEENFHTDPALLKKISEGDVSAFEYLFHQLWRYAYGVALQLTKSPEMAEDLAQEIFLKLWSNRTQLAEVQNIRAFLYSISRNLSYDYLRNKVFRESNREELMNYFGTTAQAPDFMERKELAERLNNAIAGLSPQLKQVFILSYIQGFSHREVAGKMGITPVSSRVFLARAVAQLRKVLGAICWWLLLK